VAGEPYQLGRILKISQDKFNYFNCLIAWFYRPKDVHMKRKGEARMLVATMHSDWISTGNIHGKCTIEHKDDVGDLEAYKLAPVRKRKSSQANDGRIAFGSTNCLIGSFSGSLTLFP